MKIVNLGESNSVLNRFVAELRDVNIQKDSMRFRRNIERIGEIMVELGMFGSHQLDPGSTQFGAVLFHKVIYLSRRPLTALVLNIDIRFVLNGEYIYIRAIILHITDKTFQVRRISVGIAQLALHNTMIVFQTDWRCPRGSQDGSPQ